ncbi:MAG TPA: hypothetical protein PKY77_25925 [Phycisphaerae bacterium]|nr:hypothetical protein [Phycisphaerae bacterium]HRY66843.1 hypothetical protein [Phycisphaerae bacterium]HSA26901.1 hypothetical protein [Phycisphaerae bacterium]
MSVTQSDTNEILTGTTTIIREGDWVIVRTDGRAWIYAYHLIARTWHNLEYLPEDADEERGWDGDLSKLEHGEDYWTSDAVVTDLRELLEAGRLRAADAVHGLPGAAPMGALFC